MPTPQMSASSASATSRNEDKPDRIAGLRAARKPWRQRCVVSLELRLDGNLVDAQQVKLPADGSDSEVFGVGQVESGVLHLVASPSDFLAQDNLAWAVVNPPRRTRVLLVTPGNPPLSRALKVPAAGQWSEVSESKPAHFRHARIPKASRLGNARSDRSSTAAPRSKCRRPTHCLSAHCPLSPAGRQGQSVVQPQIIDTDRAHPIMQSLELGDVDIMEARPLKPPLGGTRLIESNKGPLMAIATREGYEDAVLGFELIGVDQGSPVANTTWPIKLSFPVFLSNMLQYFGANREATSTANYRPGQAVLLRADVAGSLVVVTPSGQKIEAPPDRQSTVQLRPHRRARHL